ncbi:MAG: hypothetical protein QM820_45320 [Minicystis sp.]
MASAFVAFFSSFWLLNTNGKMAAVVVQVLQPSSTSPSQSLSRPSPHRSNMLPHTTPVQPTSPSSTWPSRSSSHPLHTSATLHEPTVDPFASQAWVPE